MSTPVVFQEGVKEEVDQVYSWYETKREGLGEDFLVEVQKVLDRIESNPEIHPPVHADVRHGRLRRFPYSVYYRIEPDRVVVIARGHGGRDPRSWRSRI